MNIFNKRPLGLILCIMLGGFSIFALLSDLPAFCAIIVAVLLCVISLFIKPFKGKLPKIACFSLLLSFLLSFFYFNYIFYPYDYFGKEVSVLAKVEEIDIKSEYYKIVDLNICEIESESANYKLKMNLYGEHEDIDVGAVISFKTVIEEFDSDCDFDFRQFYTSRGFSATCNVSDISIDSIEDPDLSYRFKIIRQNITQRVSSLSDSFSGSLLGALLLGEKDSLDGQLLLDFQRIGISHILALSGMHVAMLMGGLDVLLYVLKVRKKLRILLGCIASFMFMMLTGFPLSVTRAGVMLIISSVLYLITGCKDSITSLFIAAALIFIVNPYAALDIGLWLSIVATLGILAAVEFINQKYTEEKGLRRALRYVYTSALFSLFAIAASSAISALSFSGTSFISIFSTLVFSVLVEFYVYLGIFVLLIGNILPLGTLLVKFSSFIATSAAKFSDMPFIFGSLEFTVVKIGFILLCVLFMLFLILKIENKPRFIAIIALSYVFMSVMTVSLTEFSKNDDKFIAISDSSDRIIIKSEGKTFLFDSSLHRRSDAYYSNSLLTKEKITELDCYFVANYSDYIADSLNIVLKNNKVDKVLLPIPRSDDEELIAIECFKTVNNFRTEVSFYYDNEITTLGEYEILVPFRAYQDNSFAFTFKRGDEIYSYLSSGILENTPYSKELLYVSDKIIFGDYGTAYSYDFVIDDFGSHISSVVIFDSKVSFDFSYIEWNAPSVINSKEKAIIYD